MDLSNWILAVVGVVSVVSSFVSWTNKQQLATSRLETQSQLAAMELRLSEKISNAYVGWQAHNDLEARVRRLEELVTRGSLGMRGD